MPQKKKQHQIPKTFMKNFSQNGKLSCIIDYKNKPFLIRDIPYKNQCFENFYYGKDLVWENKLEKIENLAAPIIDSIVAGINTFDKNQIISINDFISYQVTRVPSYINKALLNEIIIFFESFKLYLNKNQDPIEKTISFDSVFEYYLRENKRNVIDKVMFLAGEIKNRLGNMRHLIVRYKTKNKLVFGDNPVMIYNDHKIGNQGIANKGVVVILPINPNTIICFYDESSYKTHEKDLLVIENEIDISKINSFQIITRNQKVYFDPENDYKKLLYLFDKTKVERQKYMANNRPKVYGSSSNKFIMINNSYFDKKIELSFLKKLIS
jgi:hypothetical protein